VLMQLNGGTTASGMTIVLSSNLSWCVVQGLL